MKLLITGASGFVGSRLASFYKEKYEVWAPTHREFDFTDKDAAWIGVKAFQPDVILHCGAISDVGTCERNPELSMKVNVEGTKNLAECCALLREQAARGKVAGDIRAFVGRGAVEQPCRGKFISCSSDQVYVRPPRSGESIHTYLTPWKESDADEPVPLYGKHKLMAEKLSQEILPDTIALRLTWMYGTLTKTEAAAGRRNMEVILREAILQKQPVTLSATDYRAVTDIGEVVRNMEKVWELPGGVYNYGSTASGPIFDTVCQAFRMAGIPGGNGEDPIQAQQETAVFGDTADIRIIKGQNGSPRNLTMDTQKLTAAGIRFEDTASGLARCIKKILES